MAVRADTPGYRVPWTSGRVTSWITTIDHKRIGILYIATSLVFFLAGGAIALLMRVQLAQAENDVVSQDTYNEVLTMHGTMMIFLVVVPVWAGFANFLVPLMIGARRHGLPAAERVLVLDVPLRRGRALLELVRRGRSRRGRLVRATRRCRCRRPATARTSGSSACTC